MALCRRGAGDQAGEAGDFAAVGASQFGQFGDESASDGGADAGGGFEQVLLVAPGGRAARAVIDFALEGRGAVIQP